MSATADTVLKPALCPASREVRRRPARGHRLGLTIITVSGALVLAVHGLAHVVGFATCWGLSGALSAGRSYTLIGGLSSSGLRTLGSLWLVASALYLTAAIELALGKRRWPLIAFAATLLSLVLCLLWLEPAKIGAIVDLVLFIGLLMKVDAGGAADDGDSQGFGPRGDTTSPSLGPGGSCRADSSHGQAGEC